MGPEHRYGAQDVSHRERESCVTPDGFCTPLSRSSWRCGSYARCDSPSTERRDPAADPTSQVVPGPSRPQGDDAGALDRWGVILSATQFSLADVPTGAQRRTV